MHHRVYPLAIVAVICCWLLACASSRNSKAGSIAAPAPPTFVMDTVLTQKLGQPVPKGVNARLIEAVVPWMGVPYKYGGNTRNGTDCSGLIGVLHPMVYGSRPARTTAALYKQIQPVAVANLQEGDLLFFSIQQSQPDHTGIFLWHGYFLHASTSRGVMISSLNEPYWKKYFVGGGRIGRMQP